MTNLETRLKDDIKSAMKSGAKADLEVLRTILSDIKNAAIAEGLEREGFGDEIVLKMLRRGVKTRSESAEMYKEAKREELEATERFQIDVLRRYLPAELSAAELEGIVDGVIAELGATTKREMGGVIKAVMAKTAGRADGKAVSGLVAGRLS
ncbi:MAG: hypothetical protein ACI9EF_000059 [Pseudohongiellaceae bacterium]|jgi:uncharacterized protein YqeY